MFWEYLEDDIVTSQILPTENVVWVLNIYDLNSDIIATITLYDMIEYIFIARHSANCTKHSIFPCYRSQDKAHHLKSQASPVPFCDRRIFFRDDALHPFMSGSTQLIEYFVYLWIQ